MINNIKEIFEYREMINSLITKELRGKYMGSFLGFLWSLLVPLFQLVIYTVVFSVFMRSSIDNFAMFLFVALIPWFFFNSCVASGATTIIQQKNLVEKIYFPRMVLPISAAISYFINMLLSFIIVFIALFISGTGFSFEALLFLPLIMMIEFIMGMGAALLFSALTVYFRDLEYVLNIITMAWMYMTPILYPINQIPEQFQGLLYINPMTSVIVAYRDILYYKQIPQLHTLLYATIYGVTTLIIGYIAFYKLQDNFVEEL